MHSRPHTERTGTGGRIAAMAVALLAPFAAASADDAAGLEPIIAVHPAYPEQAQAGGLEGRVEVEFTVTPAGGVETPRVVTAQPPGVFDSAALEAVARWRYQADPQRDVQQVRATLDFRPPRADTQVDTPAARIERRSSGPRSQCVRESSVYNYGNVIDVELISACDEPLLVYGCAQGTGRHSGRWVCTDSEQQHLLLVRSEDPRAGTTAPLSSAAGDRSFAHADTFHVTRAPNSQYWWVACLVEDQECRGVALQWARSVNLQPARVNPQHRTGLALARSF